MRIRNTGGAGRSRPFWHAARAASFLFALMLVLVACGTGDEPPDAAGDGDEAADAAGDGDEAAPDDSTDAELSGVDLTVSYMQAGTYDVAAHEIEDDFEANTGADVEVVAQPFEVLIQSYITDLSTQTGQFDVISVSSWIADVYDQLMPLDDFVERDNWDEGYIPELLRPGQGSEFFDGQRVGLPYAVDAYGVLYRTDIFDEAGVDADWETWEDLFATLDELEPSLPDGVSPFVFAYGAPEQTPAIWMSAYGGYLVDADGNYAVDREQAVEALEITQRTLEYAPDNAIALSIDEANAVFLQGDAAVLVGWPSFVRAAADNPDESEVVDQWALGSLPGPGFPWLSAWNLGISNQASDPEAAWEWIKAYTNEENAAQWMEDYGIGSPFESTYTDETALSEHAHDYPVHMENLAAVKNPPWNFEAFEAAFRNLGEMLTGEQSPEETVDAWEAAWADIPVPEALNQAAEESGLMEGS